MRASPTGSRAGWTPPFTPATPAMLSGIQSLLGTPAGLKLTAEIPSLQAVRTYSPTSDADLRAVGALGAHLPPDFEARLADATRRSQTVPDALASLTRTLGGAYRAAVPEVAQAVQARAQQVAVSVAYEQIDGRELVAAANQLERFGLYGPSVQDKASIVRRLASQQIMEHAQRIASDFLSRQRPSDDGRAQPGQGSAGTYDPGGRKKIPEAWKLRAYQKAAGSGASSAQPAPPEPKANPMSRNLYERIGAAPGMGAAQIEAAYRKTAELHRPERYIDRDTRSIITLTMAYKRIEEAFATLGDPAKRAEYDRGGLPQGPPAANPLSSNFYERVGATKDMSQADIKTAYRRAAAVYHPDKSRTKDEALVKAMTKAFQDIGEAYETLSDPQKRAAYDRKLAKDPP
ncbi:MAG: DnaJ domain-containing protein, partial [Elusimicrobiota bacterium]